MSHPTYLRTPNVPLARAWNTWSADRYVEMRFPPLGVRVTPLAFSAKAGRVSHFGPGSGAVLGEHATDGSRITADLVHAGTSLAWSYDKASPFDVVGRWKAEKLDEWGLRFWVLLALSQEDGAPWRYDAERGVASCTIGPRSVAVKAKRAPLLVTGHADVAGLVGEYETRGYWYLDSRATEAPLLVLRFNLEEAAENRFAIAIADSRDLAFDRAAELVAEPPAEPAPAMDDLAAVRDIMGWNSIWDGVNHRPYITCSRNWDLKKFGGFGFWLNDTAVNALLVSLFDSDQGRECLAHLLAGATPEGNLSCLLTGNDAWVDRTQTPLIAFILWQVHLRNPSRPLLESAYPLLARSNAWIRRVRDGNGNGLLEFGSSRAGQGLYVGTKLAAKDESMMDNSPIHDEASWQEETRTLDSEDVGLNSLVCLDCEMLGLIAAELGDAEAAARHSADAAELREKIGRELWDGERQIFANRLWSGRFVANIGPTSLFPLICAAASAEQRRHLLRHLADPSLFAGRYMLPSIARNDPAAKDNVYWRGRIWPILNWLVWLGLKRAGEEEAAGTLVRSSAELFLQGWRGGRLAPENYNAETGEGLDQADTDPFYSWTALLPYMTVSEVVDVSPWNGLSIAATGEDAHVGPVASPLGRITVARRAGVVTVSRHGRDLLSVAIPGTVTQIDLTSQSFRCRIPAMTGAGTIRLFGCSMDQVMLCRLGGEDVMPGSGEGSLDISIPPADRPRTLHIVFSEARA